MNISVNFSYSTNVCLTPPTLENLFCFQKNQFWYYSIFLQASLWYDVVDSLTESFGFCVEACPWVGFEQLAGYGGFVKLKPFGVKDMFQGWGVSIHLVCYSAIIALFWASLSVCGIALPL